MKNDLFYFKIITWNITHRSFHKNHQHKTQAEIRTESNKESSKKARSKETILLWENQDSDIAIQCVTWHSLAT